MFEYIGNKKLVSISLYAHLMAGLVYKEKCPCSVMAKVLNSGLEVCEFELQSRYFVHFRTNTL